MTRINTLFSPLDLQQRPPTPEEMKLWTMQRQVIRQKCFSYLKEDDYLKLGNSRLQHVGMLSLCSVLRSGGHKVQYLIPDRQDMTEDYLERVADCDVLLLSSFTCNFNATVNCARKVRDLNPSVLMGIGGHHAPYRSRETLLEHKGVFDFTARGYSENIINDVANAGGRNALTSFQSIPQIAFIDENGEFFKNAETNFPDLQQIPLPANDLVPIDELMAARVFSAYGCPFSCRMCNLGQEKSYSERPISLFQQELEYLINQKGVRYIYIGDPTLAANLRRFREVVEVLNAFPGVRWGGQTRLPIVQNPEFRAIIANSGCVHLEIGVESLSQRVLNKICKRISATDTEEALYKMNRNPNVYIETNWMFGIPGSDEESIRFDTEKMKQFVRDGMDIHLGMFVPFPGTDVYDHPETYGIKIEDKNWDHYTFHGGVPVFSQAEGMQSGEIAALYRETILGLQQTFEVTYDKQRFSVPTKDLTSEVSYF